MHNEHAGVIPGNALVVDASKPFRPLSRFGNAFLNRFVCSQLPNDILETVTFVDTPGILAGEKQRVDRGYEFSQILEWFADRCDRILLLFDVSSLDISDELKRAIEVLRRNDDKIRIVLNKADTVDHQALMRVYGALMWSLGKVLGTPEVCRVYVGSFWSRPLQYDTNRLLFELETKDLFNDLGEQKQSSFRLRCNTVFLVHRVIAQICYTTQTEWFDQTCAISQGSSISIHCSHWTSLFYAGPCIDHEWTEREHAECIRQRFETQRTDQRKRRKLPETDFDFLRVESASDLRENWAWTLHFLWWFS